MTASTLLTELDHVGKDLVRGGYSRHVFDFAELALRDRDGTTFGEAARTAGFDPARFGRDDETLSHIGTFIELHIEQGKGLIDLGSPLAVGSTVIAHGRWRFTFTGQGNHAGATRL